MSAGVPPKSGAAIAAATEAVVAPLPAADVTPAAADVAPVPAAAGSAPGSREPKTVACPALASGEQRLELRLYPRLPGDARRSDEPRVGDEGRPGGEGRPGD